ncbi:MAG: hypothetical protein L0241_02945 [Planctomycetia bacterium]|nr:hypothetical protein [Planctomycetia bacterium]
MLARSLAFLTLVLLIAGCGPAKLNETKTFPIDTGEAKAFDLPAVSKPQKVTVDFSTTGAEIHVLLFKEEDAKGEDGLFNSNPAKALGKKNGKADSFSADVPENTATRIIVRNASAKTDVTLKFSNTQ